MMNFAGFDLDEVYRAEENRVKDELCSKKNEREDERVISPTVLPGSLLSSQGMSGVVYKDLVFEQNAYRDAGVAGKKLFYFDASLERVKNAGYARHALPFEVFSLIIDGLEGKLSAQEQSLKTDMLVSFGEWLSMAFKRVGNTLHCYEHPENIMWTGSGYDASRMTSAGEKTFSLKKGFIHSALPSRKFIPLNDVASVCPELVQYLWSREMSQLPSDIKTRAGLWLHEEGIVWPVGRHVFNCVVYGYDFDYRASRGVVAAQKISSGSGGSL